MARERGGRHDDIAAEHLCAYVLRQREQVDGLRA
jgi:hypothetical protein